MFLCPCTVRIGYVRPAPTDVPCCEPYIKRHLRGRTREDPSILDMHGNKQMHARLHFLSHVCSMGSVQHCVSYETIFFQTR